MKKLLTIIPLTLALAAVAMPAFADDDDDRRGWRDRDRHGHYERDRDDDRRWDRRRGGDDRRWERRRDHDRYDRYDRRRAYRNGYHDGRRHEHWNRPPRVVYRPPVHRYGPPPWARGRDYRSYGYRNVYYVPYDDYGRYRLYQPGYGQRWYRDDRGNFLLVAAATGIITSVLLGHGY